MKITSTSDWREDDRVRDSHDRRRDLVPGDPTRCSVCGGDSELRARTELWAVKHRHPNQHAGYVRFYCQPHLPVVERVRVPVETAVARSLGPSARPRSGARRRSMRSRRAMCPDCFVEISATGVCGMCGLQVA